MLQAGNDLKTNIDGQTVKKLDKVLTNMSLSIIMRK
jgi:hypothetical protein